MSIVHLLCIWLKFRFISIPSFFMIICPGCNTPLHSEDKFCGECGARLQAGSSGSSSLTRDALNVTEVKFRLAGIYYKKGNIKAVIDMCRQVIEVDTNHQEALKMLSQAEQDQPEDTDT
jgi:predicted amidophosphoribosyltransferase